MGSAQTDRTTEPNGAIAVRALARGRINGSVAATLDEERFPHPILPIFEGEDGRPLWGASKTCTARVRPRAAPQGHGVAVPNV
jgi:hypothetical protein